MIPPPTSWHLGLDLAQKRDRSALATVSCEWSIKGQCPVTFDWIRVPKLIIRDIDCFPIGLSYLIYPQAVAERLTHIQALTPAYTEPSVSLAIDASGPGAPVVDEFRRARLRINLRPFIITGGHQPGSGTVPRRTLITNLLLLLDHGSLVAPAHLPYWSELRDEMLQLSASDTHPLLSTAHDDIVMALALAVWQASRSHPDLLPTASGTPRRWNPIRFIY